MKIFELSPAIWQQRIRYDSIDQWIEDANLHPYPLLFAWETMCHTYHRIDDSRKINPIRTLRFGYGLCWHINISIMILWGYYMIESKLWYFGKPLAT